MSVIINVHGQDKNIAAGVHDSGKNEDDMGAGDHHKAFVILQTSLRSATGSSDNLRIPPRVPGGSFQERCHG